MKGKIPTEVREQLKMAYPGQGLFLWTEDYTDNDYVLRPISPTLYRDLVEGLSVKEFKSEFDKKDYLNTQIFQKCVVWPELTMEEFHTVPIGTFPSIAKIVMEKSGFINITVNGDVIGPDIHSIKLQDYQTWADISEEEIATLKAKHPFALFRIRIDKFIFVIRPVIRADIQQASIAVDDQMSLVQRITMWPEEVNWDLVPTGIIDILGEQANRVSGWNLDKVKVEEL